MPKLHLNWSDGRYYTRPLSDDEAAKAEAAGCDVVYLEDDVWAAYGRDCERDAIWQEFWRAISNEQYMQRRVEFTCVFPQPGCQIEVLPPKWQESAAEILEQYNHAHAAEGIKVQGCCCGHEHEKLDDATVEQLRNCGFIVEHDSEPL